MRRASRGNPVTDLAPCPGCGRTDTLQCYHIGSIGEEYIGCDCGWNGQVADNAHAAITAWNRRAPTLRWRRAPPDVPGWWWWVASRGVTNPRVAYYAQRDCDDLAARGDRSPGWRWAGPIPAPEEAE